MGGGGAVAISDEAEATKGLGHAPTRQLLTRRRAGLDQSQVLYLQRLFTMLNHVYCICAQASHRKCPSRRRGRSRFSQPLSHLSLPVPIDRPTPPHGDARWEVGRSIPQGWRALSFCCKRLSQQVESVHRCARPLSVPQCYGAVPNTREARHASSPKSCA